MPDLQRPARFLPFEGGVAGCRRCTMTRKVETCMRERFRRLIVLTAVVLSLTSQAFAQTPPDPRRPLRSGTSKRAKMIGLVVGAGAGFGLGMLAGLQSPGASCSDRKVWLAAGSFGALGATFGYLAGDRLAHRSDSGPGRSVAGSRPTSEVLTATPQLRSGIRVLGTEVTF